MRKIIFIFALCSILHAEETKDQSWQVGSFKPAIDKQAHYLGGFGAYSMIERVSDKRVVEYGFVLLISGMKEVADSWRTVGDMADISYTVAGAISCDIILTKLKLKTKNLKFLVVTNRIVIKLRW